MAGNIRQAADDVSRAAGWASKVGQQVSTLIDDYREQGEIAMSVDAGPLKECLTFRIKLPKGKP